MHFRTVTLSKLLVFHLKNNLQSTLVISNSLISNNLLSRSENLVPVLTQRSTNMQQNIVEKRRNAPKEQFLLFSTIFFNVRISNLGVKLHIYSVKVVV